jgi:predicted TPR repeat methyltransferase
VTFDPIAKARSLASVEESAALYREWAATYDRDVFDTLGFTGSDRIADLLASYMTTRSTELIDLGCGTGAVGVRLARLVSTRLTELICHLRCSTSHALKACIALSSPWI